MSPYHRALHVYATEPCARTLDEDILLHARHGGYIIATPEVLCLARPVWHHWPHERLSQPWEVAPEGDTWWIWLVAGTLKAALPHLPRPLPWIAYERQNQPRLIPWQKFKPLLHP